VAKPAKKFGEKRGIERGIGDIAYSWEAYVTEQLTAARAEANRFEKRLKQDRRLRAANPHFLAGIWWDENGQLLARMKENWALDLFDNRLGPDGLDMTLFPPLPKK
jgi:hypothetical protein